MSNPVSVTSLPPAQKSSQTVLDKAFLVIDCVMQGPVTIAKTAHLTGISRPTAYRIFKALELSRVLTRDLLGRYTIGPRCAELTASRKHDPLQNECDDILNELQEGTGAGVYLFWADGIKLMCIAGSLSISYGIRLGVRYSPANNSFFYVLMAFSGVKRVAARTFDVSLQAALWPRVREHGWATSVSGAGITDISSPIHNHSGEVVAVVTTIGSANMLPTARLNANAEKVVEAGKELTAALARAHQRSKTE
jgi:DNA-binding IclR family transcriptional regulator